MWAGGEPARRLSRCRSDCCVQTCSAAEAVSCAETEQACTCTVCHSTWVQTLLVQVPEAQSALTLQRAPRGHLVGQSGPPQSTSVSCPFSLPSVQEACKAAGTGHHQVGLVAA